MKVWIDQDLCTGDGLCEEIAPAVFTLLDDGLAYVKEEATSRATPAARPGWPPSPGSWRTRSSRPPRSAPASASSSSGLAPPDHGSDRPAAPPLRVGDPPGVAPRRS